MKHITITAPDGAEVRETPVLLRRRPKGWTGAVDAATARRLIADGLATAADAPPEPAPELTDAETRVLKAAASDVLAQQQRGAAAAAAAAAMVPPVHAAITSEPVVEPIDEFDPPPDPAADRKAVVKAARKAGRTPT